MIQDQAPEIAEFLTECREYFGKPAAVRVVINGKVILDAGGMR